MTKKEAVPGSYAMKVSEETRRYAHELLTENEKLRAFVASFRIENQRLEEKVRAAEPLAIEHEAFRGLVGSLEREKNHLQEQLLRVRENLERHRQDQARLRTQLAEIETQNRRFSEEFVDVERQNNNLMNLYVASYRLHGTIDRQEVVATIQEILANLIGSEEQAIFEVNASGTALSLLASVGIDADRFRTVPFGSGIIGCTAQQGDIYVAGSEPQAVAELVERDLTACVPLKLNGNVIGALAIFRLLPQKSGLEAVDHEMFDLLATHAATALYCTALHAKHNVAA